MIRLRAFTLIELLVVISIIALLVSILVSVVARARGQANTVICQSSLRQWGYIFTLYTENNNNYFCTGLLDGKDDGYSDMFWWIKPLLPYGTGEGIRLCPVATKLYNDGARCPFGAWYKVDGAVVYAGSYGPNGWLCNPPVSFASLHGRTPIKDHWRHPAVRGANDIPLFLDCRTDDGWPRQTDQPPVYDGDPQESPAVNEMKRFCINRHNGFINGVFFDSSARKIGLKELWKLKWHRNYKVNDPGPVWPVWMRKFKDY